MSNKYTTSLEKEIADMFISEEGIDINQIISDSIKLYYGKPLSNNEIKNIEKEFNFKCGKQLNSFLKTYGSLSLYDFELCSSLIIKEGTRFLRKSVENRSDIIDDCIVIADVGNGDSYLIDKNDNIYYFDHESPKDDIDKMKKLPGDIYNMKFDSWVKYEIEYALKHKTIIKPYKKR